MKNVYEVAYEAKYKTIKWMPDKQRILANGDAQRAIDICKRTALKSFVEDEIKGKVVRRKATGFRLVSVEYVTHVDVVE